MSEKRYKLVIHNVSEIEEIETPGGFSRDEAIERALTYAEDEDELSDTIEAEAREAYNLRDYFCFGYSSLEIDLEEI